MRETHEDRYQVIGISGYGIGTATSESTKLATSFSVIDTAHMGREVYRRYAEGRDGTEVRRRKCEQEAARLNELDQLDTGWLFDYMCEGCLETVRLTRFDYYDRGGIIRCHDCTEAT